MRSAVLILFVLASCATLSSPPTTRPSSPQNPFEIYVIRHRFHTGIAMAKVHLPEAMSALKRDFDRFEFVEIGFGDRAFYMAPEDSAWLGIRALLWRNDAVLHVAGFNGPPELEFNQHEIVGAVLNSQQMSALAKYMAESLAEGTILKSGLYGNSYFYPANGSFHLFNTCNVWTATALERAGLGIDSTWAITSRSVLDQLAQIGFIIRGEEEGLAH
jgi:uncharacterized protein (TIGR02117 family)